MSTAILQTIARIEAALVAANVPPLSPYWRAELTRFYLHPTARLLVENVGRGGDKSRTSVIMAIAETLAGEHRIAHGERHYYTHISENMTEAAKTLRVLQSYLEILRIPHSRTGDTIDLESMPKGFKVLACRVGAVSGWRCYGWTADECAKYSNDGVDPSEEVIASIRAMTITHPGARGRMFSSPLGAVGFFFATWSKGDTIAQLAGHAASWEANPSITREHSRTLEPNERVWSREYAALAQSSITAVLDIVTIDRAMLARAENISIAQTFERFMCLDFSRGKDDQVWLVARFVDEQPELTEDTAPPPPNGEKWCWPVPPRVSVAYVESNGSVVPSPNAERQTTKGNWYPFRAGNMEPRRVLDVEEIGEVPKGYSVEQAIAHIVKVAETPRPIAWGVERVKTVILDQFEADSLSLHLRHAGLSPHLQTWTNPSKRAGIDRLERLLRDSKIRLPANPKLRKQLSEYSEKITRAGNLTYEGSGAHDDYAAVVLTLAQALVFTRLIKGNPDRTVNYRTEVQ